MLVRDLIKELHRWPSDLEVYLHACGMMKPIADIDMEQGGVSSWIIISDTKPESEEDDAG